MPHPTDIHVGKRLREVRIMRGLTQTQLGEKLGISFQQCQKYEKGTNRIGASRLWHLCEILDTPISFYFEGLGDKGAEDEKISRRALQLAKELDRIDDDDVKTNFLRLLRVYNGGQSIGARA